MKDLQYQLFPHTGGWWGVRFGQLLSKGQVLCSEKRSESEFCPNESCEAHEYFYHRASFAGRWKIVNNFSLDEFYEGQLTNQGEAVSALVR